MISKKALEEVAEFGGFVVFPSHSKMYSDFPERFTVYRPSWYDDEKRTLTVNSVQYAEDEEGYSKFLNDWSLDLMHQVLEVKLVNKPQDE